MKRLRPETPKIDVKDLLNQVANEAQGKQQSQMQSEALFKNFNSFMKQIIDTQNTQFLNGNVNMIDYVLSKYLKVDVGEVEKLMKISIRINGTYGLLNQFGQRLSNLLYLKLSNSLIQSISDIGTSFSKLKILQMNNCRLKELNGIVCFEHLEVFEAKNNLINDLIEIEMCSSIVKLDLENNIIEDEENIYFLSSLDKLEYLNLKGNPLRNYEEKLKELCPSLLHIDENVNICDDDYDKYLSSKLMNTTINLSDSIST